MICLLFIIAILTVVGQGSQLSGCTNPYYAVNSIGAKSTFAFTCYGEGSNCTVFYAPPGAGCDEESTTSIGSVIDNTTAVLSHDFLLGSGFCSDKQIAVYSYESGTTMQLPRATEAGTNFRLGLYNRGPTIDYECTLSALSSPASVKWSLHDQDPEETIDIGRFKSQQFNFTANSNTEMILKVVSDNPIIAFCIAFDFAQISIILEPISSEPLFFSTLNEGLITVVLSDCSTNDLITDFDRVKLLANKPDDCILTPIETDMLRFNVGPSCYVRLNPLNNTCVSMAKHFQSSVDDVGLPESKFSTQFAKFFGFLSSDIFSFSLTTCTGLDQNLSVSVVNLSWLQGDLNGIVSHAKFPENFSQINWSCDHPVTLRNVGILDLFALRIGYQSEELWQPFFQTECSIQPSHAARSGLYFMSWFIFIQINFLHL